MPRIWKHISHAVQKRLWSSLVSDSTREVFTPGAPLLQTCASFYMTLKCKSSVSSVIEYVYLN